MAEIKRRGKKLTLSGWGRFPKSTSLAYRPEFTADMGREFLAGGGEERGASLVAHGGGRSYGDQALNDQKAVILTARWDRLLAFDAASGMVVAEAGVTFAELMKIFLPQGWLPPVMPGTAYVTLGGAVANDVHGKNHDQKGSFGQNLAWFDLMIPSGEIKRVSLESEPDLFRATLGGCGLTGVILRVALPMQRVAGDKINVRSQRMASLGQFIAALKDERSRAERSQAESAGQNSPRQYYAVGWIDALAHGKNLGRGILQVGEIEPGAGNDLAFTALSAGERHTRKFPLDLPSFALNRAVVRGFNAMYFRRVPARGCQTDTLLQKFLFPLDAILHWNRLYGKRGFQQFQCVIPDDQAETAMAEILTTSQRLGTASFLAVLKSLGGDGLGYLSFPMRGMTLALDFPRHAGSDELFRALHAIVRQYHGRVYLAKDSALTAADLASMYPNLPQFLAVRRTLDPQGRFSSDMARRLGL
ncbi:MAG: FAD-binding oxidoreductase [Candidatus Symbiobacter sp.]|nr:FAD-binding oxidoreductase [Candidatus Symbiobacter sp.]